jgi:hypothetical protein
LRIGSYSIPDVRLFPDLVEATRKIYETYPNEEINDANALAQLLGHKSNKSGTFLLKMTCLRTYGLIEGRGAVRVSELGKKMTFGTPEEKSEATRKVILGIPLWNELFVKFGVNLPTDNFWAHLAKIAGLEAPEAQRVSEQVRKAYLDDIHYLPQTGGEKIEPADKGKEPEKVYDTEALMIPGGAKVVLPKEGMEEAWKKLKRTVDAYFGKAS